MRKDGTVASGKLEKFANDRLYIRPVESEQKAATRAFILPLVLFDLLAIGTIPFAGGGFGGGFGPGPYGPYGPGGPGPYGPYGPGPGPYGPYGPGPGPYGGKGFF
ncbi:hypothetical protein ACLBWT_20350 [Paenibacillus sp. D51F]